MPTSARKWSRCCRRRCAPEGGSDVAAELDAFLETLRARALFERGASLAVSRAPGRLDVMGGIADYSGSLVLQRPIAEAAFAAVQRIDRPVLEVVSLGRPPCTIPLEALAPGGVPLSYQDARRMFADEEGTPGQGNTVPHWVSYVAGVILTLAHECGMPLTTGARIVVASQVPEGKGVSSSAAVETASMRAAADVLGVALDPRDLALLCQKSENLISGAPCGVMDQMTCVFGERDALLALLCQPAELQPPVPVPEDVEFWGIDSGERHAVGGSDYGAVRAGAFMGLRIVREHVRLRAVTPGASAGQAGVPVDYLANIAPAEFERDFVPCLPDEMSGDDFLARYAGTSDTVTRVERGRRYRVRAPAAHPVYERHRAERFRELLRTSPGEDRRVQLGALMYESHASYVAW